MSRRRLTLAAYVARRWRPIGAIVVLLLGALLVLVVTERGHDPLWTATGPEVAQAAISPDASAVYALLRENGNLTRLQAREGESGGIVWESGLNATRALVTAGRSGAAVATDFPLAFLTVYDVGGSPRWQVPLEGNPIALEMEDDRVALALNAPGNPVLVFQGDRLERTYHLPSAVRALDLEGGLLAAGGLGGEIVVFRGDERIVDLTLRVSIRSLRVAQEGAALVAGGLSLAPDDASGAVVFIDLDGGEPLRWSRPTPVGVGLVDIDQAGLLAMAIEETPPTATVHVYEGATGATRWTRLVSGSVARDDAGASGGAAMSPDGSVVAVGTLRGQAQLLDARTGEELWSYRGGGVSLATFSHDDPDRILVAGRLLESRPFDSMMLFSTTAEPSTQRAPVVAGVLFASAAFALVLAVGVGFWRARRPY